MKQKEVNYAIASATNLPAPFKDLEAIPTTFFIDRKGVIQSVAVGTREYAELKDLALAKDFEGEPKRAPAAPISDAKEATNSVKNP